MHLLEVLLEELEIQKHCKEHLPFLFVYSGCQQELKVKIEVLTQVGEHLLVYQVSICQSKCLV